MIWCSLKLAQCLTAKGLCILASQLLQQQKPTILNNNHRFIVKLLLQIDVINSNINNLVRILLSIVNWKIFSVFGH